MPRHSGETGDRYRIAPADSSKSTEPKAPMHHGGHFSRPSHPLLICAGRRRAKVLSRLRFDDHARLCLAQGRGDNGAVTGAPDAEHDRQIAFATQSHHVAGGEAEQLLGCE